MRISNELQIGKAGEYMVCADLILKGFVAFPSEQGLPYDVLMDNGKRLLRVQVKTTTGPRTIPQRAKESQAYIFNIKRHGSNNAQRYNGNEVDIFSLVCLDTRKVGYLLNGDMPATLNLRVDALRGSHFDELGELNYQRAVELSKEGKSNFEISVQLGMHVSQVYRMLSQDYTPFKTNALYFSDIERGPEWFDGL